MRLAIIPAKGSSNRFPNKNIADFDGLPLFIRAYFTALESRLFDKIHISTESDQIIRIANEYNITIDFKRPKDLSTPDASLDSVFKFVLNTYHEDHDIYFDEFCVVWATAPLKSPNDIVQSYNLLQNCNAVISVSEFDLPFYCGMSIKNNQLEMIFPKMFWKKSQDMPKTYVTNSSIAWLKSRVFLAEETWIPSNSRPYIMPRSRSIDIDFQSDLKLAKFHWSNYKHD